MQWLLTPSNGSVSFEELTTLLSHFPEFALNAVNAITDNPPQHGPMNHKANELAHSAFALFDLDTADRLSFDQFSQWCDKTPCIAKVEFCLAIDLMRSLYSTYCPMETKLMLLLVTDSTRTVQCERQTQL